MLIHQVLLWDTLPVAEGENLSDSKTLTHASSRFLTPGHLLKISSGSACYPLPSLHPLSPPFFFLMAYYYCQNVTCPLCQEKWLSLECPIRSGYRIEVLCLTVPEVPKAWLKGCNHQAVAVWCPAGLLGQQGLLGLSLEFHQTASVYRGLARMINFGKVKKNQVSSH